MSVVPRYWYETGIVPPADEDKLVNDIIGKLFGSSTRNNHEYLGQ
jgi:hypothetical protein